MGKKTYSNARPDVSVLGLIFDMDGVLFDTERDSIVNIIRIGGEMGFTISREMVITNMGRNMAEEKVIYRKALGDAFDADKFWDLYWEDRYRRFEKTGIPVKAGALGLLKIAKERGIPCVVASSSPSAEVWKALKMANIDTYFSGVIGGDMFEKGKPNPDIFLAGAKILGLDPENCIVIEDSLNGMKAGRAAGMQVVFVKDIPSYPEEELDRYADYSFDSAEEIVEIL